MPLYRELWAESCWTGMPKATGAPPPKGFGPELPGRDPVEPGWRATAMSSLKKCETGMPKATGAPPPKGVGPELPGRDPVGQATTE